MAHRTHRCRTRQLYTLAACSAQLHTSYSLATRALNRSTALPQVCRDRHHVNGPRHGPQVAHNAVERWRGIGGSASALSVRHPSRSSTSSRRAACARARRLQLKLPWYIRSSLLATPMVATTECRRALWSTDKNCSPPTPAESSMSDSPALHRGRRTRSNKRAPHEHTYYLIQVSLCL